MEDLSLKWICSICCGVLFFACSSDSPDADSGSDDVVDSGDSSDTGAISDNSINIGHFFCLVHQNDKSTVTGQLDPETGEQRIYIFDSNDPTDATDALRSVRDAGLDGAQVSVHLALGSAFVQCARNFAKASAELNFPISWFIEDDASTIEMFDDFMATPVIATAPPIVVNDKKLIGLYRDLNEELQGHITSLEGYLPLFEGLRANKIVAAGLSDAIITQYGQNVVSDQHIDEFINDTLSQNLTYGHWVLAGWDTLADAAADDAAPHLKEGGGMIWPEQVAGFDDGPSAAWLHTRYQVGAGRTGLWPWPLDEQIEDSSMWPNERLGFDAWDAMVGLVPQAGD